MNECVRKITNKKSTMQFPHKNAYLALCFLSLLACLVFVCRTGIFGSKVDWISQHSVFPEYFRQQFYETGDLFPEFALHIGGGQNIYHFAYYGLYSPIILLSYLLPFVKMPDYLMAASFACLSASVMLMYRWLESRGFSQKIAFGTAVMFLLAGPMVFHSYNQIMFVSYMPFLCMGFLGIDRYLWHRQSGMLVISVFLMIMTSFYFSIGGMLVLVIYGIHRCLEIYGRNVLKYMAHLIACIFTAVLMSGVLLVPTAMALIGRSGSTEKQSISETVRLLLPQFSIGRFFFSPYGIGLTALAAAALFSMLFFRELHMRILAWSNIIILTVPIFSYLLNGGLYIRDKALIPFLPLLCYITAYFLQAVEKGEKLMCGLALKKRNPLIFFVPSITLLMISGYLINDQADYALSPDFYAELTDKRIEKQITDVIENETGLYRTEQMGTDDENAANLNRIYSGGQYISSVYSSSYNEEYQKFRTETFQLEQPYRNLLMQPVSKNLIFQRFMSVKYVFEDGNVSVNQDASPAAYATNQLLSEEVYRNLEFPYNQLALLKYAVVEEKELKAGNEKRITENEVRNTFSVSAVELSLPDEVHSGKTQTLNLDFPKSILNANDSDSVLFIQFDVENLEPSQDIAIWAEGIRNKLTSENHFYYNQNTTFTYVVPLKDAQTQMKMRFGKGYYQIKNVKCYLSTLPKKSTSGLYQSEFTPDKSRTKGNVIAGTIHVQKNGHFITTIPYDENFEIRVNGKTIESEKVNTAFLGFQTEAGEKEIEIIYHAPGSSLGKVISVIGVLLFILINCLNYKLRTHIKPVKKARK